MRLELNGQWILKLDPEENGFAEEWMKHPLDSDITVSVPGCIQQLDCLSSDYPPHDGLRNGYIGTFFIEKSFFIQSLNEGERWRLFIGGAAPTSYIWVNGKLVSKSIYCLSHLKIDITDFLVVGINRITIAITELYSSLMRGMRFEGADWSGVYGQVYIDVGGVIDFLDTYISFKNGIGKLCGKITNADSEEYNGNIVASFDDNKVSINVTVPANGAIEYSHVINIDNLKHWSYRTPNLVNIVMNCVDRYGNSCIQELKTGIRQVETTKDRILVDGYPTLFAGAGEEYYSPTIAPLTDRSLIEARFAAMKKYGFNYFRYHTHIPTEEELTIADEMGMMISLEFGIVSNFNKLTPSNKAMDMYEIYVRQTRYHPSLFIYGLGNEGSQLMIESREECEKAIDGYRRIKKNTDNQLAIIAYGLQGELPNLDNDIETPHLWSENFVWAYDGLTDIPWSALRETCKGKPALIHEYGKFCVWPSLEEENSSTIPEGMIPNFGRLSHAWIKKNRLESIENRLIINSRKAANRFTKNALEEARRQSFISGYVLWSFFRDGWRCRGLSDDVGKHTNGEHDILRNGANAEIAILIDRGFQNRAFACGIEQSINVYVSNLGITDINGTIHTALRDSNGSILYKNLFNINIKKGETKNVGCIDFAVSSSCNGQKIELNAYLSVSETTVAQNKWDFWVFDLSSDTETDMLFHVKDSTLYRQLKRVFPKGYLLSSVDSIVIGCRSWRHPRLSETALARKDTLIITDNYDDIIRTCIIGGAKVLFLDSGNLPAEWFYPPLSNDIPERDLSRSFTSFRCGWDRGNLASLIVQDKAIKSFPNDGYCDLQFYDMIQTAAPMNIKAIGDSLSSKPDRIISTFAKIPALDENEIYVQDRNAIIEMTTVPASHFNAREQGYLIRISDKVLACSLRLMDNAAGIYLLKQLVQNF